MVPGLFRVLTTLYDNSSLVLCIALDPWLVFREFLFPSAPAETNDTTISQSQDP